MVKASRFMVCSFFGICRIIPAPCTVLDFPTREAFERELTENAYDVVGRPRNTGLPIIYMIPIGQHNLRTLRDRPCPPSSISQASPRHSPGTKFRSQMYRRTI